MAELKAADKLAKGGQPKKNRVSEKPSSLSTLAEQGIDKNLADAARKMAKGTRGNVSNFEPGGLSKNPPEDREPTLADQGINKNLADFCMAPSPRGPVAGPKTKSWMPGTCIL